MNQSDIEDVIMPDEPIQGDSGGWFEKKVPLALLFVLLMQFLSGVWFVSSYYTQQKVLQDQMQDNFKVMKVEMESLKNEIYTRKEAIVQFESINNVNQRQNDEIRELRDLIFDEIRRADRQDERRKDRWNN